MSGRRFRLPMVTAGLGLSLLAACGGGGGPEPPAPASAEPSFEELVRLFDYDQGAPLDLEYVATTTEPGAEIHDIRYPSPKGGTVSAYLVMPLQDGPYAGLVFLHWSEGDRSEFLDEAVGLAPRGVASVLFDAPWKCPGYVEMAPDDLYIRQVVDARRAVDVLAARPDVDVTRLGYVGHSNGAIWGGVLAGVERRIRAYVLMTGYARPSVYYRPYPVPVPSSRLDAIHYIGHAAPATLLFQFGALDSNVPDTAAGEFYAAASQPKLIRWYDAGHALNEQARLDRADWLGSGLDF
jgi:dienelactone hydrolase